MTAPIIAGHRFVELIDEGGFATVYRYVRESLGREVAIKVMRADALADLSHEEFRAEAMIMARLSGHPNIVTIHDHGTLHDGRPYLVMEYCPPPNLKVRAERERLPVGYVLEIGILIAGAVETAHRAGVLHRDIKPANILMDGYGPKLTDFGISEMRGGLGRGADGVSVPWAPIEALRGEDVDVLGDVYSLAATLYTALTGRWPFEIPGGANELTDLMARMQTGAPQPVRRGDVPTRLEQVLRRSLHPDPDRRHRSALDLADGLRAAGLPGWMPPTPLVPEETARAAKELTLTTGRRSAVTGLTRPAPGRSPGTPPAGKTSPSPGAGLGATTGHPLAHAGTLPRSRVPVHSLPPGGSGTADLDLTQARAPAASQPSSSRRPVVVGAVAAVLLGAAAIGVLLLPGDEATPDRTPERTVEVDPAPVDAGQPAPAGWSRTASSAVVRWTAPADARPGDEYQWRRAAVSGEPLGAVTTTQETTASVAGVERTAQVCLQVWVVRGGVPSSRKLLTCDPEAG